MKFYVIGDVAIDYTYYLNRVPLVGEEIVPTKATLLPGGAGGTLAYYIAQLKNDVTLAARVGDDPLKDLAFDNLERVGVNLSAMQVDKDIFTSTITIMITPDGKRTMISSTTVSRQLDVSAYKKRDVESADALVISAYAMMVGSQQEYALRAIESAQKAKIPIFIDLGGTGAVYAAVQGLVDNVKVADYLLMNQLELLRLTGKNSISAAVEDLSQQGVGKVVVKVGPIGSIIWTPTESELVEGYEVEDVVDTTGAGDAYTAAFAHAILQGFDMKKAARYANVVGAMVARDIGAQSTKIDHNDIVKRMRI